MVRNSRESVLARLQEWAYFEPLAVAFTEVPANVKRFYWQRRRWAGGMIEALKIIKPWQQPIKYLSGINLVMPYLDIVYTFCWIPGLVLPLAMIQNYILYNYQKDMSRSCSRLTACESKF